MEFKDIKSKDIDVIEISKDANQILSQLEIEKNDDKVVELINKFQELYKFCVTEISLINVRFDLDTINPENIKAFSRVNEIRPVLENIVARYYMYLANNSDNKRLHELLGHQIFTIAKSTLQTINAKVIPLLIKENKLVHKYTDIIANGVIHFESKNHNLSEISEFTKSTNRNTRKQAQQAISQFYDANSKIIESIFMELVETRKMIAQTLGFKSYIDLAYKRMNRTDYTKSEISNFRNHILKNIVPYVDELKKVQQKDLELDNLYYYDESIFSMDNLIKISDSSDLVMKRVLNNITKLSTDFKDFSTKVLEFNSYDLNARKGKKKGARCTYLPNYELPFIFTSMSEKNPDISTILHELGHALQNYLSKDHVTPEYYTATSELAEISSMTMELIGSTLTTESFSNGHKHYNYKELVKSLTFLPFSCMVDEFQHFIYSNEVTSIDDIKNKWKELDKVYRPYKSYDEDVHLSSGNYWYRIRHIFENPFYYIDYALAQMSAYELWLEYLKDRDNALKKYIKLLNIGGSESYLNTLNKCNLRNPLIKSEFMYITKSIIAYLEKFKKSKVENGENTKTSHLSQYIFVL